jgi:hypothetical protein
VTVTGDLSEDVPQLETAEVSFAVPSQGSVGPWIQRVVMVVCRTIS